MKKKNNGFLKRLLRLLFIKINLSKLYVILPINIIVLANKIYI